jgi:hypothetical protein
MQVVSAFLRPDTVTLFNSSPDGNKTKWRATTLVRVRFEDGRAVRLARRGIETQDTSTLLIDLRDYDSGGKAYVQSDDWTRQSDADKDTSWTIKTEADFFITRKVDDADLNLSKEELMQKYPVFSLTGLSTKRADEGKPIILVAVAR